MKDFLGQITCGGLPVSVVFGTVYAALLHIDRSATFWSTKVGTFEAVDYFIIILIGLAFVTYVVLVIVGTSILWLRVAASLLGLEEAKRIYHRTPSYGFGRQWNVSFVNWVLKNA